MRNIQFQNTNKYVKKVSEKILSIFMKISQLESSLSNSYNTVDINKSLVYGQKYFNRYDEN